MINNKVYSSHQFDKLKRKMANFSRILKSIAPNDS